jgi:hypothetical protein
VAGLQPLAEPILALRRRQRKLVLTHGVEISFDRPYGKYRQIFSNPQTVGSGEYLCWEFPLAYWLEQHGYDVSYCSNSDLLTPDRALKSKCFVSIGHDEYWDLRQYESVKALIAGGVTPFFSRATPSAV